MESTGEKKETDRGETKAVIEALIFASEVPLTLDKLKEILKLPRAELKSRLDELVSYYESATRGFYLREVAHGYQFRTKQEYAVWIQRLKRVRAIRLSQPMMETLAIIAYKQPVTRVEIEQIRGVDSDGIVKSLLEKRIITMLGRKDVPGKPFLFGTTPKFLEVFGLASLKDLPPFEELSRLGEEEMTLFSTDEERTEEKKGEDA